MTTGKAGSPGRRLYETGVESRRRVLDAAEQLIAERGFEKTSIVEISRRSGVSRGSIPWHFTNKDGILLAVIERATERYFVEESLRDDPTIQGVFARFAQLMRGVHGRLLFVALNQAITATGPVRAQYQEFYANERRKLDSWLDLEGVSSSPRRTALASVILSTLLGAAVQWLVDPDGLDLEQTVASLADIVEERLPAAMAVDTA